ncbi:hypothetical protein P43SY_001680 [Pythium insidiosum]|uniref:Interferon-related developmental regulator N-terminal domain-containing protein n=1 Tax=Pythium insidiosum TaxID=114742 RepID=A0AAD5MAA6_PYTIN|nr:hypothetical protein P43SY_001680 [Pythium insidiosum]
MTRHHARPPKGRQLSSHARRRLSEEGKRLLRRALSHDLEEGEEQRGGFGIGGYQKMGSEDLSVVSNFDDSSAGSDLESFQEWQAQDLSVVSNFDDSSAGSDLESFQEWQAQVAPVDQLAASNGGAGTGGKKKGKAQKHKGRAAADDAEGHDELEEAIEQLTEKRDTTKITALQKILSILCSTVLTDRIQSSKLELTSHALNTLKKRMKDSGSALQQDLNDRTEFGRFSSSNDPNTVPSATAHVHLYENPVLRDVFEVSDNENAKISMISTVRRRADHRAKAINKRNDISRKGAAQNAFLYED